MAHVSSTYKKLILSFFLVLSLLAIVILYFTLNKVEIIIKPKLVSKEASFYVDLYENPEKAVKNDNALIVKGKLDSLEYENSGTYESTGEKEVEISGDYPVIGKVTLYNDQDEEQVLIRRTRLLSPDNKLVRLTEKVKIPAHGSVEVEVYYDPEETNFEAIKACKWTIPGLGKNLQKLVYAESKETFIKPGNKVKYIRQEDLENAYEDLTEKKLDEILNELKSRYSNGGPVALAYKAERIEENADHELGDISDSFTATVKLKVIVAVLDRDQIYKVIDDKLHENLDPGYELINLSVDKLKYYLEKYDLNAKTAQIKVTASGNLRITEKSPKLDKNNFVGLTREQLIQYFKTMDDIKEVEIRFYPSFLKTVPAILDHIEIRIQ